MDLNKMEDDELENRITDDRFYIRLFAMYLVRDELLSAKHLWSRIPQEQKLDPELKQLKLLLKTLLNNNTSEFFTAVNYAWSEDLQNLMAKLKAKVLEDTLTLIGQAYETIFETQLSEITKLTPQELKGKYADRQWTITKEANGDSIVIPNQSPKKPNFCYSSENQLLKLTEFVSFLEN